MLGVSSLKAKTCVTDGTVQYGKEATVHTVFGLLDLADEGTVVFQNVRNYLNKSTLYPTRLESFAELSGGFKILTKSLNMIQSFPKVNFSYFVSRQILWLFSFV
jgi:hypothetical protein